MSNLLPKTFLNVKETDHHSYPKSCRYKQIETHHRKINTFLSMLRL